MLTRRPRTLAVVLMTLGLLSVVSPASAQDSAMAAALFDKGLAEMQAGRYETACPALAESHRLDPLPGALFTLAECEAKAGKIASAVAHYDDYLEQFARMPPQQQSGQLGRDKIASEQKQRLSPHVPLLTLVLPNNVHTGTVIKRDGIVLGMAAIGTPLPVDPGEHVITTSVAGAPDHEQRVTVLADERKRVDLEFVVPPAPAAPTASPSPGAIATEPTARASAPQTIPRPAPVGSNHTLGYVIGGVGLAGIILGSVTGVMVLGKKSTADDHCNDLRCNSEGIEAVRSGRTLGWVSTAGCGLGAVGLATGLVLILTGGEKQRETGRVSLQPSLASPTGNDAVVGLRGAW